MFADGNSGDLTGTRRSSAPASPFKDRPPGPAIEGAWSRVPTRGAGPGAAVQGSLIYHGHSLVFFGGVNAVSGVHGSEAQVLSLSSGEWTPLSRFSVESPRDHAVGDTGAEGVSDGESGGTDEEGRENAPSTSPSPRVGHSAVVIGDTMLVYGGTDEHGLFPADVETLDLSLMRWRARELRDALSESALTRTLLEGVALPRPRIRHTAVAYNGAMWVLMGETCSPLGLFRGSSLAPYDAGFWRYDPPRGCADSRGRAERTRTATKEMEGKWSCVMDRLPATAGLGRPPLSLAGHSAAVHGAQMFVLGGSTGSGCVGGLGGVIHAYHFELNCWAALAIAPHPVPSVRSRFAFWAHGGRLFVHGGADDRGDRCFGDLWSLDVSRVTEAASGAPTNTPTATTGNVPPLQWVSIQTTAGVASALRAGHAGVTHEGAVFIVGGERRSSSRLCPRILSGAASAVGGRTFGESTLVERLDFAFPCAAPLRELALRWIAWNQGDTGVMATTASRHLPPSLATEIRQRLGQFSGNEDSE